MFSLILFFVSLAGLVALFALKSLELSRNTRTPFSHVRQFGDSLVQSSSLQCRSAYRAFSLKAVRAGTEWIRTAVRDARASCDAALRGLAARLNRYLRGRRVEMRQNGEPSARLKTALQKAEDTTPPPPPSL